MGSPVPAVFRHAGLDNGFRQLFNKERNAVSLRCDMFHQVLGQPLALGNMGNEFLNRSTLQTTQCQQVDGRPRGPWRGKFRRTKNQQDEEVQAEQPAQ